MKKIYLILTLVIGSVAFGQSDFLSTPQSNSTGVAPEWPSFSEKALFTACTYGMSHIQVSQDVSRRALKDVKSLIDEMEDYGMKTMALSTLLKIVSRSFRSVENTAELFEDISKKKIYDYIAHNELIVRLQTLFETGDELAVIPSSLQYLNNIEFKRLSLEDKVDIVRSCGRIVKGTIAEAVSARSNKRKLNFSETAPSCPLEEIERRVIPSEHDHPDCFVGVMNYYSGCPDMERFYNYINFGHVA